MTTKEAVTHVLKSTGITKYKLAQKLGAHPPSVDQWLRRTRMSKAYADKFNELFNVQVTDAV
jgi:DNA-binding transcriptional regulator YdaS (Cro superfamily)